MARVWVGKHAGVVTSAQTYSLLCPQGGWEDDETVEVAAQRETMEEAGVRGVLEVRLPCLEVHLQSL